MSSASESKTADSIVEKIIFAICYALCLYIGYSITEYFDIRLIGEGSKPLERSYGPIAQLAGVVFGILFMFTQVALVGAAAALTVGIPIYVIFHKKMGEGAGYFVFSFMIASVLCAAAAFASSKIIENRSQELLAAAERYYSGTNRVKKSVTMSVGDPAICVVTVDHNIKTVGERRPKSISIEYDGKIIQATAQVLQENSRPMCEFVRENASHMEKSITLYPSKNGLALVDYEGDVYFCLKFAETGGCEHKTKKIKQQLLPNKCLAFEEQEGSDHIEWVRCPMDFAIPAEGMESVKAKIAIDYESSAFNIKGLTKLYPSSSSR